MKTCSKCKVKKPPEAFTKDAQKKDGLRSSCRECSKPYNISALARARVRKWQIENPEKLRAAKRTHYDTHIRRPRKPKDLTAPTRAKKNWKLKNPVKMRADRALRRAKELQAAPVWANEFFIQEAYALARLRTKQQTGGVTKWHVDHIVPLRSKLVCGLHNEFNLCVTPAVHNMTKGNRHWPDMPGEKHG